MDKTATITVAAPPEDVWAHVGDPARWPSWMDGLKTVKGASGDAAVGAELALGFGWWSGAQEVRVTEVEAPRRLAYAWTSMDGAQTLVAEVAPQGSDSVVTLAMSMDDALAKVTSAVAGSDYQRFLDASAQKLQALCES